MTEGIFSPAGSARSQRRLSPRVLVVLLAGCLALLNAGGLIFLLTGRLEMTLSIDQELYLRWPLWDSRINTPALANALVLGAAGTALFRHPGLRGRRGASRLVGAGLVFMAFDELFSVHELLETASGIDWLVLYLPVIGLLAVGSLFLLIGWWRVGLRRPTWLFAAGGTCWAVAQVLELLQWESEFVRAPGYWGYVFVEESLEFTGSSLFLLAALFALGYFTGRDTRP